MLTSNRSIMDSIRDITSFPDHFAYFVPGERPQYAHFAPGKRPVFGVSDTFFDPHNPKKKIFHVIENRTTLSGTKEAIQDLPVIQELLDKKREISVRFQERTVTIIRGGKPSLETEVEIEELRVLSYDLLIFPIIEFCDAASSAKHHLYVEENQGNFFSETPDEAVDLASSSHVIRAQRVMDRLVEYNNYYSQVSFRTFPMPIEPHYASSFWLQDHPLYEKVGNIYIVIIRLNSNYDVNVGEIYGEDQDNENVRVKVADSREVLLPDRFFAPASDDKFLENRIENLLRLEGSLFPQTNLLKHSPLNFHILMSILTSNFKNLDCVDTPRPSTVRVFRNFFPGKAPSIGREHSFFDGDVEGDDFVYNHKLYFNVSDPSTGLSLRKILGYVDEGRRVSIKTTEKVRAYLPLRTPPHQKEKARPSPIQRLVLGVGNGTVSVHEIRVERFHIPTLLFFPVLVRRPDHTSQFLAPTNGSLFSEGMARASTEQGQFEGYVTRAKRLFHSIFPPDQWDTLNFYPSPEEQKIKTYRFDHDHVESVNTVVVTINLKQGQELPQALQSRTLAINLDPEFLSPLQDVQTARGRATSLFRRIFAESQMSESQAEAAIMIPQIERLIQTFARRNF